MASTGYAYCVLHDSYFADHEDRQRHIQSSSDHPQCHICDRRFKDNNALRNHWIVAKYHYYCRDCEKHFESPAGLEFHIDEIHIGGYDSDDSDEEDEYDAEPVYYDGWEDDQGIERYPDGVPAESEAHKLGVEDDNSWEDCDDLDFEDEEDLADLPELQDDQSSNDSDCVLDEDDEHLVHQFECPMCEKNECATICTTRCGHIFCAPCITGAFKYTEACPICDESGDVSQLRRIYISEQ
ncbi:putative zinc-finger-containing protein [Lentinula raphanica]|nr:putative zinc-finger-containing protein [Lentinula raphanica]